MIKLYCDKCGKQLNSNYDNCVNIDFNSYGVANFKYHNKTLNMCVQCAEKLYESIDVKEECEREDDE